MSNTKKYYWLKLKRDFFKRHDMKIIESMENGKDYALFYLKLLLESIDHGGALRFSETIPYNEKMLSTITDTNIDIARSAVRVFTELGMMECLDDGTLYMSQIESMIGSETSAAERMRISREKRKELISQQEQGEHCYNLLHECSEMSQICSPEIEIDKDIELDKESEKDKEPTFFQETDTKNTFIPAESTTSLMEVSRKYWNSKGLPKYNYTPMNLPADARVKIIGALSAYGLVSVKKAIDNYVEIITNPGKYEYDPKFQYRMFPNFMERGVALFSDDINPLIRYARKKTDPGFSDFDQSVPERTPEEEAIIAAQLEEATRGLL